MTAAITLGGVSTDGEPQRVFSEEFDDTFLVGSLRSVR